MNWLKYKRSFMLLVMAAILIMACSTEVSGQGDGKNPSSEESGDGGYLFAHMTGADYGKLFYSVSRDGITWETLNRKEIILNDYLGHPDICEGPDVIGNAPRRWYMIGVVGGSPRVERPVLWHSTDLVLWKRMELDGDDFVVDHLGVYNEIPYIGAPKMFYDEDSGQFLITWHAGQYMKKVWELQDAKAPTAEIEAAKRKNWETMTTCFTVTKDFKTFTRPKRFFSDHAAGDQAPLYFTGADANIGMIDVIVRKFDGKYYAIVKDERWEDKAPVTYKGIRVASSDNLLGPYSALGPIITPHGVEAQIVLKTPDGKFRCYYERLGARVYAMRESTAMQGAPWKDVTIYPPVARHGCIVRVDEETYQNILDNY